MMQATRAPEATLNDLLDRLLDTGLVLNADLIVSAAGIPLLGVNLNLVLAGIETMLEYGMMQDWDEAQRAVARREIKKDKLTLLENEEIILSMFGTYWYSKGIYHNWRPGHFYVTNKRLLLFRKMPAEILFETPFERIRGMALCRKKHLTGEEREELALLLEGEGVARLHAMDTAALRDAIAERLKIRGIALEENPVFPIVDEVVTAFLHPGEQVTHTAKVWHLMSLPAPGGVISATWKPGHLYLTDERLCWWYDFDGKLLFEASFDRIRHVTVVRRDLGGTLQQREILLVLHENGRQDEVASFAGDNQSMHEWAKVVGERLGKAEDERGTDTCPRCGRRAPVAELLGEGCPRCGWASPRLKRQL